MILTLNRYIKNKYKTIVIDIINVEYNIIFVKLITFNVGINKRFTIEIIKVMKIIFIMSLSITLEK